MSATPPEHWHRLHPLSPLVRGGRATIAVFIILIPIAFGRDSLGRETPQLGVIALIVLVVCLVIIAFGFFAQVMHSFVR